VVRCEGKMLEGIKKFSKIDKNKRELK